MTIEQLREKADRLKTLRYDAHIFIPKNIIPMIAKDVATGQWYSESVKEAMEDGILTANEAGNFRPQDNVTRAELSMVVKRLKEAGILPIG